MNFSACVFTLFNLTRLVLGSDLCFSFLETYWSCLSETFESQAGT